ncbi:MAG: hypothetical protein ACKO3W_11670 [bacterium]
MDRLAQLPHPGLARVDPSLGTDLRAPLRLDLFHEIGVDGGATGFRCLPGLLRSDRSDHGFARPLELGVGQLSVTVQSTQIIQGEGGGCIFGRLHPGPNTHDHKPTHDDHGDQSENGTADLKDEADGILVGG